ncbi:MAG: hypothetical protein JWO59_508, partial [Chloroflexi bacterium]|nr:hypothetical protein [Chloroflexota bacterium]
MTVPRTWRTTSILVAILVLITALFPVAAG